MIYIIASFGPCLSLAVARAVFYFQPALRGCLRTALLVVCLWGCCCALPNTCVTLPCLCFPAHCLSAFCFASTQMWKRPCGPARSKQSWLFIIVWLLHCFMVPLYYLQWKQTQFVKLISYCFIISRIKTAFLLSLLSNQMTWAMTNSRSTKFFSPSLNDIASSSLLPSFAKTASYHHSSLTHPNPPSESLWCKC